MRVHVIDITGEDPVTIKGRIESIAETETGDLIDVRPALNIRYGGSHDPGGERYLLFLLFEAF